MKNSMKTVSFAALAVLVGAVGCGDDKKSSDGGGSASGAPAKKLLLELSTSEAKSLCEWFNKKVGEIGGTEKQYCTSDAVSETTTKAECEDYVETCIDDGGYAGDESLDCTGFQIEDEVGNDCEATVDELQKCISAQVPLERKALSEPSCDKPGEDHSYDFPAACETLYDKCPGFYGE